MIAKKRIVHNKKGTNTIYTYNQLYSYLQDIFDETRNMQYEIPIVADSKKKYSLIHGWTINKAGLKYLKGWPLKNGKN